MGFPPAFGATAACLTALLAFAASLQGASAQAAPEAEAVCMATNHTLTPAGEQGPYYVDDHLFRQNITEYITGAPFAMTFNILDDECNPVEGAFVDIWHCSGIGYYSAESYSTGGSSLDLLNTTYLRGVWPTDASGQATFYSIIPGWYSGRTTHIHLQVHIPLVNGTELAEFTDSHLTLEGQTFFNDTFVEGVYESAPYTSNQMGTRVLLDEDRVFVDQEEAEPYVIWDITDDPTTGGYIGSVTLIVSLNPNVTTSLGDASAQGTSIGGGGGQAFGQAGAPGQQPPQGTGGMPPPMAGLSGLTGSMPGGGPGLPSSVTGRKMK